MRAALQPERPLEQTGVSVTLVGYGTGPLGKDRVSARPCRALPPPRQQPRHIMSAYVFPFPHQAR